MSVIRNVDDDLFRATLCGTHSGADILRKLLAARECSYHRLGRVELENNKATRIAVVRSWSNDPLWLVSRSTASRSIKWNQLIRNYEVLIELGIRRLNRFYHINCCGPQVATLQRSSLLAWARLWFIVAGCRRWLSSPVIVTGYRCRPVLVENMRFNHFKFSKDRKTWVDLRAGRREWGKRRV